MIRRAGTGDIGRLMELLGEGWSDRQIAKKTGIPQTTVSYRRKVLLKKIRENLKNVCSL
jgi:DNA-binding NarL/FixJ family response regulator